ncbi:transposase [Microbispora amethystogenes]|uniref:transposase n=1 Tax=Microbispora amethystogenes TaxID=1427754 RepID=UPI003F4D3776
MPDMVGPRRAASGVPQDVAFATKPHLVIEMLQQEVDAQTPFAYLAADAGYGRDPGLRALCHGLPAAPATEEVQCGSDPGRCRRSAVLVIGNDVQRPESRAKAISAPPACAADELGFSPDRPASRMKSQRPGKRER